jgi:hypothetical protein
LRDSRLRLDKHSRVEVMDRGAAARGQMHQPCAPQRSNMFRYGLSTQAVASVNQTYAQLEQGLIVSSRKLIDQCETNRIAQRSEDCIHVARLATFWLPINH